MSTITWVHISDLHWQESQAYDANIIGKALLRDLAERAEIAPELAHVDFIFVTGDITATGRREEYESARQFFKDLLQITGVRKSGLFLVPGNHDVDRSIIADGAHDIVNKLASRQMVSRLLDDEANRATIMPRFHHYRQFVNNYLGKYLPFDNARYFYVKTREVAGRRIAILGLNSAWASASDNDRHNLLLGERQVRAALDQAKRADIRIALVHHPFEWLQDFDRSSCEPLLLRGCDFVLHGHSHCEHVVRLQAPGSKAIVIGAGACYDTREYSWMYDLVCLDFGSRRGTVYLRMYSDRQGEFWSKNLLTRSKAPGEYAFDLPYGWVTASHAKLMNPAITTGPRGKTGLDQWWKERLYRSNPFMWSNAADVDEESLAELFQLWHVDPQTDPRLLGLGPTPTLDKVMSLNAGALVFVYASAGSGKTFYRRLAVRQIEESMQYALDLSNIADKVSDRENITARDLALCIYKHVYERFSLKEASSVVEESAEQVLDIFQQCDNVIRHSLPDSQSRSRVYVFIDDIDQLFDDHPSRAKQNTQALAAIVDFCEVAAMRDENEPLALRMFIPAQLMEPIQRRLGLRQHRQIREITISWSVKHCLDVIERRLDSLWQQGPNTGISHLSRLLTTDARDEFLRWLQQQETISPRCVIEVLNGLVEVAYSHGVATGMIDVELWRAFVGSGKPTIVCAPDAVYPFESITGRLGIWLRSLSLMTLLSGLRHSPSGT